MPLVQEHGITFVHWSERAHLKVWKELSSHIIGRFGRGPFINRADVEPVLNESFAWMLERFRLLTATELGSGFYKSLVGLYENSTQLMQFVNNGTGFTHMSTQEYAHNRSSVRLALERACELDLKRTSDEARFSTRQMELLEDLLFIGMWAFSFSETIAMEKLMDGCNEVYIDPDDTMRMTMSHHFSKLMPHIRAEVERLTSRSIVDQNGVKELKAALKTCLGIDYEKNAGLVPAYKGAHPQGFPMLVDLKYDDLVEQFATNSGFDIEATKVFYAGLATTAASKESLENIIYRPHSNKRHMARPVLVWNIQGQQRAIVGPEKWTESIMLIVANAVQWGQIAEEWLTNPCMKAFVERKADEHDKELENPVEQALKEKKIKYSRNVKTLKAKSGTGVRIDTAGLGEIDFLYIDEVEKEVCVVDCKYHRRRDNMVGYSRDYANFLKDYEPKLKRKGDWFKNNLALVGEHFEREYPGSTVNLTGYAVRGFFIVNTPTYYSFNGAYRAYTIQEFRELMDGTLKDVEFYIEDGDDIAFIQRPYFQKPIQLDLSGLDLDEP